LRFEKATHFYAVSWTA